MMKTLRMVERYTKSNSYKWSARASHPSQAAIKFPHNGRSNGFLLAPMYPHRNISERTTSMHSFTTAHNVQTCFRYTQREIEPTKANRPRIHQLLMESITLCLFTSLISHSMGKWFKKLRAPFAYIYVCVQECVLWVKASERDCCYFCICFEMLMVGADVRERWELENHFHLINTGNWIRHTK